MAKASSPVRPGFQALPMRAEVFHSRSFVSFPMFNFSADHLFLISRTEYPSCAVLLMLDADTRRVYRLLDSPNTCASPQVEPTA